MSQVAINKSSDWTKMVSVHVQCGLKENQAAIRLCSLLSTQTLTVNAKVFIQPFDAMDCKEISFVADGILVNGSGAVRVPSRLEAQRVERETLCVGWTLHIPIRRCLSLHSLSDNDHAVGLPLRITAVLTLRNDNGNGKRQERVGSAQLYVPMASLLGELLLYRPAAARVNYTCLVVGNKKVGKSLLINTVATCVSADYHVHTRALVPSIARKPLSGAFDMAPLRLTLVENNSRAWYSSLVEHLNNVDVVCFVVKAGQTRGLQRVVDAIQQVRRERIGVVVAVNVLDSSDSHETFAMTKAALQEAMGAAKAVRFCRVLSYHERDSKAVYVDQVCYEFLKMLLAVASDSARLRAERTDRTTADAERQAAACVASTMLDDVPQRFLDPISLELMRDPVCTADGQTYERASIAAWLRTHRTSPLTNELLPHTELCCNNAVRAAIREWRDECLTHCTCEQQH